MLSESQIREFMEKPDLSQLELSSVRITEDGDFQALFIFQQQVFQRSGPQIRALSRFHLFPDRLLKSMGILTSLNQKDADSFWWFFKLTLEQEALNQNFYGLKNFFGDCCFQNEVLPTEGIVEQLKNFGVRVGSKMGMFASPDFQRTVLVDKLHGALIEVQTSINASTKMLASVNEQLEKHSSRELLSAFAVQYFELVRRFYFKVKNELLAIENTVMLTPGFDRAEAAKSIETTMAYFFLNRKYYDGKEAEIDKMFGLTDASEDKLVE